MVQWLGLTSTTGSGRGRTGDEVRNEVAQEPQGRVKERASRPDPEVSAKARRRRFSAEYKLRIVREADVCKQPGDIGALLRREGLYSSHLATWRRQVAEGVLVSLKSRKRGPKPDADKALAKRLAGLEAENRRLEKRLREAETIIAFQKKLAELLDAGRSGKEMRKGDETSR